MRLRSKRPDSDDSRIENRTDERSRIRAFPKAGTNSSSGFQANLEWRDDVHATVGLLRGDVCGSHDCAAAVPGAAEFAGAALDRGYDLIGDVLVDVKALFHGTGSFATGRVIATSGGEGNRKRGAAVSNAARMRAAKRGGAAQAKRGSEPR